MLYFIMTEMPFKTFRSKDFLFIHCLHFYFMFLCNSYGVEELKSVNYEVVLLNPIKRGEDVTQPVVYVTSKSGQEFQCMLPQVIEEVSVNEKEVTTEKDANVKELLNPMKSSCLTKGKDWWTYELCFGLYIKQFHVEDGEIVGPVITLGLYDSDYDWDNETDQEKFKHTKQRYHSQYYNNGTKCDLTGKPRNAEVRMYCEEDAGDYIYRVDEPGTCSYIITVHSSRLCSHPLLKPLPSNKAHSISCHPLLTEKQYSNYLNKKEETLTEKKSQILNIEKDENKEYFKEGKNEKFKAVKGKQGELRSVMLRIYLKVIEKMEELIPSKEFIMLKSTIEKEINVAKNTAIYVNSETEDTLFLQSVTNLKSILQELDEVENNVVKASKLLEKALSIILAYQDGVSKRSSKPEEKENKDSDSNAEISKSKNEQNQLSASDEKLQLRIRRLERKSEANGKVHEMEFDQRKKLEEAVNEKLEKAGFDAGGRKIEVKIITAGYYDNEDGKDFHALSDEETDLFKNVITAFLTGQPEAIHEMKRHKKLEENYNNVWYDDSEDENVD